MYAHSFLYYAQRTAIADIALRLDSTGGRGDLLAVQEQRHRDVNTSAISSTVSVYTIFEIAHFRVQHQIGRHPAYAHGTGNISCWTSSTRRIMEVMMGLYDKIVDPDLLVRRVTVVAVSSFQSLS